MEHDCLGRASGKFAGAMEYLKSSAIFPEGMLQTEIRVPLLRFKTIFDTSFSLFGGMSSNVP